MWGGATWPSDGGGHDSSIPEVVVKDTIKEEITGQELDVSVHNNSLNGGR